MPLDPSYLEYPHRSYGMDHGRYDWSMLTDRKPVEWPGGKRLASGSICRCSTTR